MGRGPLFRAIALCRGHLLPQARSPVSYAVLAQPFGRLFPSSEGRLPTCYSPVRHSTHAIAPFAFDLHVLGTPPAFVLSQDQTLQLEIEEDLNRQISRPCFGPRVAIRVPHPRSALQRNQEIDCEIRNHLGLAIWFSKTEPTSASACRPASESAVAVSFAGAQLLQRASTLRQASASPLRTRDT